MTRRRFAVAALALLLAACGEDPDGLVARFHSDRAIPGQAEELEVIVSTTGLELSRERFSLGEVAAFPATLGLVRGEETPGQVRVQGDLYLGGMVVATGNEAGVFVEGEIRYVDVDLIDL